MKKQGAGYKVVDAITESRTNHNTLVEALNTLSKQLDDISAKIDAKASSDVMENISDIRDTVIPTLKLSITKNRELYDAKIKDACNDLNIQHEQLEAHGRRLNVIWNGRREEKKKVATPSGGTRDYEDTETLFREFLVNSLQFTPEYVSTIILRDVHRLPKSKRRGTDQPPPIIAAFICQRHRNDVLASARHLQGTNFSIKSDLPKRLNEIRSKMLQTRSDLKKEGKVVRLIERQYLPQLQLRDVNNKWNIVYDVDGPKDLLPVPARNEED